MYIKGFKTIFIILIFIIMCYFQTWRFIYWLCFALVEMQQVLRGNFFLGKIKILFVYWPTLLHLVSSIAKREVSDLPLEQIKPIDPYRTYSQFTSSLAMCSKQIKGMATPYFCAYFTHGTKLDVWKPLVSFIWCTQKIISEVD